MERKEKPLNLHFKIVSGIPPEIQIRNREGKNKTKAPTFTHHLHTYKTTGEKLACKQSEWRCNMCGKWQRKNKTTTAKKNG